MTADRKPADDARARFKVLLNAFYCAVRSNALAWERDEPTDEESLDRTEAAVIAAHEAAVALNQGREASAGDAYTLDDFFRDAGRLNLTAADFAAALKERPEFAADRNARTEAPQEARSDERERAEQPSASGVATYTLDDIENACIDAGAPRSYFDGIRVSLAAAYPQPAGSADDAGGGA